MSKKLNALDLAFLSLEKQTTPVNVASLMILQCPEDDKGTFARDLLKKLEDQPVGSPSIKSLVLLAQQSYRAGSQTKILISIIMCAIRLCPNLARWKTC